MIQAIGNFVHQECIAKKIHMHKIVDITPFRVCRSPKIHNL